MAYPPFFNLNNISCSPGSYRAARYSNPNQCEDGRDSDTGAYICYPWGNASHNNSAAIDAKGPTLIGFGNTPIAGKIAAVAIAPIVADMVNP